MTLQCTGYVYRGKHVNTTTQARPVKKRMTRREKTVTKTEKKQCQKKKKKMTKREEKNDKERYN